MELKQIKNKVITAILSDDELFDILVLKGGTALEALGFNQRASIDIDFSMEDEFEESEMEDIKKRIKRNLKNTFNPEGIDIFDLKFKKSPTKVTKEKEKFWGGYDLEFKLIEEEIRKEYNLEDQRRRAIVIDNNQGKKFKVDISRFEICNPKKSIEIEGYQVYVYTPLLLIYEKYRAICQQTEQYASKLKVSRTPRARDFYDIHTILHEKHQDYFEEKILEKENLRLLLKIFEIKKVSIDLLKEISKDREFHRNNFSSVVDTVINSRNIESFDFYFDYTTRKANKIYDEILKL